MKAQIPIGYTAERPAFVEDPLFQQAFEASCILCWHLDSTDLRGSVEELLVGSHIGKNGKKRLYPNRAFFWEQVVDEPSRPFLAILVREPIR